MTPTNHVGDNGDFSVVGIGASAGGLEALTEFFRAVPVGTGLGFVVVTHLDPSHKSMLAELLGKETQMPVHLIENGMRVERGNVYVIPPDSVLSIDGRTLRLRAREPTQGPRLPIDTFFRSLAENHRDRAVGIVLSGTGADGSLGLGAIKEQGGTTFVQDPLSADFDAMPRSAIATGSADFIFPPDALARAMARIGHNLTASETPNAAEGQLAPDDESHFERILTMLNEVVGVDFREYRKNSIRRRLRRRLVIQEIPSLGAYVLHLESHPDELRVLAQDFLIRVTRFFRDPELFVALRHSVFPHLIRDRADIAPIRAWVPGCASGEEVYSIAMCFAEAAQELSSQVPIQIFGSDVNPIAIEAARAATYPENIALDVSPQNLERFFSWSGTTYQVRKALRELCVFSVHDLTKDPPFGRMDLVSCRNVMIYFDSPLQRKVIPRLHFALRPDGYLVMGKSESTSTFSHLFTPIDKKSNISVRKMPFQIPSSAGGRLSYGAQNERPFASSAVSNLKRYVEETVAGQYGPPAIVVNEDLNVLFAHRDVERYVRPALGDASAEILELSSDALRTFVRGAIATVRKSGEATRSEGCDVGSEQKPELVDLCVIPLSAKEGAFLLLLEKSNSEGRGLHPAQTPGGQLEQELEKLRQEFRTSRTHLRTLLSEHQAALEEQSAANEELQSLNEELESAKEDVESSNAELIAVNKELQTRNTDLNVARELAQATTDAIREALLVLNSDLCVVSANSTFLRIFQITPEKVVNVNLSEIGNGQWNSPGLFAALKGILAENKPFDDLEVDVDLPRQGHRYMLLSGRRVEHNRTILLAMEDVTEKKALEERLRQSQKLEGIGQLAGGVAHDFNNILTGIMGNASLIRDALPAEHELVPLADQVISGTERAAGLTRQLLAYAGKGRFFLERVDISKLVVSTGQLIQASIPRKVQVLMDLDQKPPIILADSSQIQQIIMNLIINAAEAVGEANGTIRVVTSGTWIEANQPVESFIEDKVAPGRYVCLEVHDDGCGMDEDTRRQIFSPFFTTKFTGRGLGLASILGAVRSHHGIVQVHSTPGKGSTFRVLLPETPGGSSAPAAVESKRKDHRGTGTVLIVDDEAIISNFSKVAFERCGYKTITAENGQTALDAIKRLGQEISLVLLDVTMPVMGGVETLARIRDVHPELPVLVTSGFSEEQTVVQFHGLRLNGYLQKPYTADLLMTKVAEVSGEKQAAGDEVNAG